jgi:type I restriction enzyme S subunit
MMTETKNTKAFLNTEIPSDWDVKELGVIGELKNGINKEKEDFGFGFPMVNLMDVFGINKVYKNNFQLGLVNATERDIKEYSLKKGDVLFIRSSVKPEGVGLTTVICDDLENTTYSGFIIRFRDNGCLDLEYKAHCFFEEGFRRRLLNKSTISANTNINQGALNSLKLPIPPLSEQKAIAQVLSTADAAIHTTEKIIAQKVLRKKWLMQQLLTGKKRLKGFENTKWKIQPLENFIKPIVREVSKPSTPYLGIGLRSHGKGTFLKHDEQPEKNSMDNFYVVRPNDLIVNITFAWEQAIAIVRPEDDGALASHRFPTYTFIEDKGHPDFFRFYILQPRMKFMLEMISPGGAGRNRVMSKSDFIKLEFLFPEYKEQTAIAQVLQSADKEISLLKAKAEKLREQKKGLMQVLLTGKVRLKIN